MATYGLVEHVSVAGFSELRLQAQTSASDSTTPQFQLLVSLN